MKELDLIKEILSTKNNFNEIGMLEIEKKSINIILNCIEEIWNDKKRLYCMTNGNKIEYKIEDDNNLNKSVKSINNNTYKGKNYNINNFTINYDKKDETTLLIQSDNLINVSDEHDNIEFKIRNNIVRISGKFSFSPFILKFKTHINNYREIEPIKAKIYIYDENKKLNEINEWSLDTFEELRDLYFQQMIDKRKELYSGRNDHIKAIDESYNEYISGNRRRK